MRSLGYLTILILMTELAWGRAPAVEPIIEIPKADFPYQELPQDELQQFDIEESQSVEGETTIRLPLTQYQQLLAMDLNDNASQGPSWWWLLAIGSLPLAVRLGIYLQYRKQTEETAEVISLNQYRSSQEGEKDKEKKSEIKKAS